MVRTGFDDRPTREDKSMSVSNVLTRRTFTRQAKPTVACATQLLPAGRLANMGAFNGGGTRDPPNLASQQAVAPPGFCNSGEVRYGSIGGLEYEVPQSRLYCLCINVDLCSTALQCICRVIRRSSMTMKAHTYYIIFGRPPIGGKLPPFPP